MKAKISNIAAAFIATSVRERMLKKTCEHAALYEARWTMNALLREAPDLHAALEEQIDMFHDSMTTGDDADIIEQGEATCRGWQAAIAKMEQSGIADDAIHIGQFGETVVAVGRQQCAPGWLREQYGAELVWLTPREVAAMWFHYRETHAIKKEWPDAEIIEIREKEMDDAVR